MIRTRLRRPLLAAAIASAGILACGGDDLVGEHRERARARFERGEPREAMIELTNALKLRPDDAALNHEVADALRLLGNTAEARFYYREAWELDPSDSEAAMQVVSLVSDSDRDRALAIIEEVEAARPNDPWPHVGRAQLALESGDAEAAVAHATHSVELDPDFAEGYLQLARAYQSALQSDIRKRRTPLASTYEAALAALDRHADLTSGSPWRAPLERARVYSIWAGYAPDARASFKEAFAAAQQAGARRAQWNILDLADSYARRIRDGVFLGWALERKVELDPANPKIWDELAKNLNRRGGSYEQVIADWKARAPSSPHPYIAYANHLAVSQDLRAAESYLEDQIAAGAPAASLLAALARIQIRHGVAERATETVKRLTADYPDTREADLLQAWRFLHELRPLIAIQILTAAEWSGESIEAQRLLAEAYATKGDKPREAAALERLVELSPPDARMTKRLEARLAYAQGNYRRALHLFAMLNKRGTRLSEAELIWYARSAYEGDSPALGRKILHELIEHPPHSLLATIELARREGRTKSQMRIARFGFDRNLEATPLSRRAINEAVALELAGGDEESALARIETALAAASAAEQASADLYVLRAQAYQRLGRIEEARLDAWKAFEEDAAYPEALPTLVRLYADDAAEELKRRGGFTVEHSAREHALMGRLYQIVGNTTMARWSFEQALNSGGEIPAIRNDLAFILAHQGTDLPRALLLAQQAAQQLGQSADVSDTLGYVRLAMGEAPEAELHFRHAIELANLAGRPTAEYRYHLGLAMRDLGKNEAAAQSIERALALDDHFSDAKAARDVLERLRGSPS